MYKSVYMCAMIAHNILPGNIIDCPPPPTALARVEQAQIIILHVFKFLFIASRLLVHGQQNYAAFHFIQSDLYVTHIEYNNLKVLYDNCALKTNIKLKTDFNCSSFQLK